MLGLGECLWKVYGSSVRFDRMFKTQRSCLNVQSFNPRPGDAVLLHGGADIWPGMYGQKALPECHTQKLLLRDVHEFRILEKALENNIPVIGMCRGAQLLCVFAGGTLFQHVDGHTNNPHGLMTSTGQMIPFAPADHHQIMRPTNAEFCHYEPLAWTDGRIGRQCPLPSDAIKADDWEMEWELEVVYFPAVRGLAIQGHPEWGTNDPTYREFNEYIDKLVEEYILA